MKNFKSAFTLAEVLLSLTIIGVIAAISIPQVYNAVNNAQTNATVGRAVEQIELGAQNMMQSYIAEHPEKPAVTTFSDMLDKSGNMPSEDDFITPLGLTEIDGHSGKYRLDKLRASISFSTPYKNEGKPTDKFISVFIDVNGPETGPNHVERDVYNFDLLNNGRLRAYSENAKEAIDNGFKQN